MGKYLGLPEYFGKKKRDIFSPIVDKIKIKASSWSNRHLSAAGRLVMLKSVLSPVPSHAMSCFKLPVSLCDRIQSAFTRFWWDGSSETQKLASVSWDKMTRHKGNGGLRFRDVQSYNDAFLAKLSWRLINNPSFARSDSQYFAETSFLYAQGRSVESHG